MWKCRIDSYQLFINLAGQKQQSCTINEFILHTVTVSGLFCEIVYEKIFNFPEKICDTCQVQRQNIDMPSMRTS